MLSGYGGSSKPSLAEMAALANIPVKIGGVDGSQVEAYVEAGRLTEVTDYCLTDVLATYSVFLRYEMVRGELRTAHFDASGRACGLSFKDIWSNGRCCRRSYSAGA